MFFKLTKQLKKNIKKKKFDGETIKETNMSTSKNLSFKSDQDLKSFFGIKLNRNLEKNGNKSEFEIPAFRKYDYN